MGIIETLIVALTFLANLLIALIVYQNNPKSWTNRLLSILAFIFASWTIFNFFALSPNTESVRLFWVKVVMMVTAPMGVTVYVLSEIFPQERLLVGRKKIVFIVLLTSVTALLGLSPWMFSSLKNLPNESFSLTPGWAIALFALSHFTFTLWGFVIQFKRWRKSTGRLKRQWLLFFLGNILTVSLITLSNFIAVVFFGSIKYTFIGPTFTLFLAGFLAYAILKHRLLDIRLVLVRVVGYSVFLVLIGAWLTTFLFTYVTSFLGYPTTISQVFLLALVTIVVAVLMRPLKRLSEKTTNALFFRDRYDPNVLLEKLGKTLSSTIELEKLTEQFLTTLVQEMKISFGMIVLVSDHSIMWAKIAGAETKPELDEQEIDRLFNDATKTENHLLLFDEVSESPVKNIMRNRKLYVVIPLQIKTEKIGLILLGEKKSGEIYNNDDVNVLQIVTPAVVVAVGNALSYEEIRRFSITLQEEVERATADLQVANKKLIQVDKLKDEFVSLASHELRTPMTAIKSYTWMVLNNKAGELTPKGREYLDVVFQSTERLIRLVNEMLDISRIESGRIQMKIESFDLVKLLAEIKEEFAARVSEKQLTLEVVCSEKEIPMTADRGKILQIIENLVGNSVKFTPAGGKITVTATKTDHQATIAVADNGKGIKPEDLGKLFQKFGRLEEGSLTSFAESGTGLGLYLAKQYAKLHGGDITVASEFGKGATFTVILPLTYRGRPNGNASS